METINTLNKPKSVVFNGVKYCLMGARKYYLEYHSRNEDRKGAKGLHIAIWEYYNGKEVPKGYCVHHKDGNTFNNDISNLECVEVKKHLSDHAKANLARDEYRAKNKEILDSAREKASEWHRSPEGRAWHRQHALTMTRTLKTLTCEFCGNEFQSPYADTRFCSDSCGGKYRRKFVLNYVGVCKECGKEFRYGKGTPKEKDKEFCSVSCKAKYINKHRKLNKKKGE